RGSRSAAGPSARAIKSSDGRCCCRRTRCPPPLGHPPGLPREPFLPRTTPASGRRPLSPSSWADLLGVFFEPRRTQHVRQAVVAFVARVLINIAARRRPRHHRGPRLRPDGGVVNRELV